MGYSFIIGEFKPEFSNEDGLEAYIRLWAEDARDENSPAYDEPTDHSNERWPSYSAWWNFCKFTGLVHLFYTEDGKRTRGGHPGAFPIEKVFQAEVDAAVERLKSRHPDVVADMNTSRECDWQYARLMWLKYWTDWAIENCEHPVFANY